MSLQSRSRHAVLMLLKESEVGQKMTGCSAFKACRVAGSVPKLNGSMQFISQAVSQKGNMSCLLPPLRDFSVFLV